jgi:hypothetical protein
MFFVLISTTNNQTTKTTKTTKTTYGDRASNLDALDERVGAKHLCDAETITLLGMNQHTICVYIYTYIEQNNHNNTSRELSACKTRARAHHRVWPKLNTSSTNALPCAASDGTLRKLSSMMLFVNKSIFGQRARQQQQQQQQSSNKTKKVAHKKRLAHKNGCASLSDNVFDVAE